MNYFNNQRRLWSFFNSTSKWLKYSKRRDTVAEKEESYSFTSMTSLTLIVKFLEIQESHSLPSMIRENAKFL